MKALDVLIVVALVAGGLLFVGGFATAKVNRPARKKGPLVHLGGLGGCPPGQTLQVASRQPDAAMICR